MPLTKKGKKIKKSFKKQYGKDADKVFYASANKGTLKALLKNLRAEASIMKEMLMEQPHLLVIHKLIQEI